MASRASTSISTIIVLSIVVMVNLLSTRFSFRMDFTQNKQYTLNKATKELLENLQYPVTVKAYFSDDLPPDFLRARNQFKDLLVEYAAYSRGMLVYEFINPNDDEAVEKKVMERGVRPVMIEVREKDQKKQQKAYLSAVVGMHEEMETIPLLQPGGAMEYSLSSAIKKLSQSEKPQIGFIQGHGEPAPSELMQAMAGLSVMYNVQPYYIAGGTVPGPDKYAAMLWVRPTDSIPQWHFDFMDEYIGNGGHVMVAYNPVEGDFVNMLAIQKYTGITEWLVKKGVRVERNLVVDARCGTVTIQQSQGMFSFANNISFPFLPLLQGISNHDVSGGLEAIMLEFPSEINYAGDTTVLFEPFLVTSPKSGALPAPQVLDVQKEWSDRDFNRSKIVVGASLSGAIHGDRFSKMLVISDGDFAINGPREQARQLQPDNVNLFINGVDWMVDDTGLIGLRTRGVVARPLDPVEDQTKTILKYGNALLPILLVILYGLIRAQRRKILRRKRMNETYTA